MVSEVIVSEPLPNLVFYAVAEIVHVVGLVHNK